MSRLVLTRQLLERFQRGDLDAERMLFDKFRAPLLRRATGHAIMAGLSPVVSPEDVVQEVFWRALSAGYLDHFEDRGRGSLLGLLGMILNRTLYDMARRRGSGKRGAGVRHISLGSSSLEASPREDSGASPTSSVRLRDLLRFCRARLDDQEWQVWKAVELEGSSRSAAALALGTSLRPLERTLLRAKRKLATAMRQEEAAGATR